MSISSDEYFQIHLKREPNACFINIQWTQTSLRHLQDVLKRLRSLTTKPDVVKTSGKRRLIYDILKTSDLQCLEDVRFTLSSRRPIYDILKTSDLRCLEDVWFTSSWGRPIYDVYKTSVKQRLISNVVVTSIQRQKKLFFLILYCLKYSENFKCSCLGKYLGMKFCKLLRFFNPS